MSHLQESTSSSRDKNASPSDCGLDMPNLQPPSGPSSSYPGSMELYEMEGYVLQSLELLASTPTTQYYGPEIPQNEAIPRCKRPKIYPYQNPGGGLFYPVVMLFHRESYITQIVPSMHHTRNPKALAKELRRQSESVCIVFDCVLWPRCQIDKSPMLMHGRVLSQFGLGDKGSAYLWHTRIASDRSEHQCALIEGCKRCRNLSYHVTEKFPGHSYSKLSSYRVVIRLETKLLFIITQAIMASLIATNHVRIFPGEVMN